jgi:xanthine dehydrogenase accessory factor
VQRDLAQALAQLLQNGERGALATVVRVSGSTPQRPGARLLMLSDGSLVGTVGGGAIEHLVLEALTACLNGAESQLLVRELGHELAMCCGGRMEVFVEPIQAVPRLVLCGAGHVSQALAPLALGLGFEVLVIDDRELNSEERFPGVRHELRCPAEQLRDQPLTSNDWLLIATHDHALDEKVLELALSQPARYIGLVGSRRKVLRLLERIRARRGELDLTRLHAPVGLALNAVGPAEIAVSIAAELVALRRSAQVPHMRSVEAPRRLRMGSGSP